MKCGAVLFSINHSFATINDENEQLKNVYKQLQVDAQGIDDFLNEPDSVDCDKYNIMTSRLFVISSCLFQEIYRIVLSVL